MWREDQSSLCETEVRAIKFARQFLSLKKYLYVIIRGTTIL